MEEGEISFYGGGVARRAAEYIPCFVCSMCCYGERKQGNCECEGKREGEAVSLLPG